MTYACFKLDALTRSLWRVTFSNPPINLIDVRMIAELGEPFVRMENGEGPSVLIFDSADPDYFLAHSDISKYYLAAKTSTVSLLSGTGTSIVLYLTKSSNPMCTGSLVGSRPSIVRLWRTSSTSSTRCLYRSFRHSWMHSCGQRPAPGYRREPAKPSSTDFRRARMSSFVSRSI
jgi:hypothetical protein